MTSTTTPEPLVTEQTYNATADKVWEAITDNMKMKDWYFNLEEFKPEPGFEFRFSAGPPDKSYLHICKITQIIPGKKLSYSWRYDGYPGNSEVTFELVPEGEKTTLKLTHSGLATFSNEDANFSRDSFAKGWAHITGISLKNYLEQQ